MGIDVWEAIDAAATKPFGFMKFTPGPGMGGHCIPVDPLYLSRKMKSINWLPWRALSTLASEIDRTMPRYVVTKIQDALNRQQEAPERQQGADFGRGVQAKRERPARISGFDVIHLLQEKGALVSYYDPFVPEVIMSRKAHEFRERPGRCGWKKANFVAIINVRCKVDYNLVFEKAQLIFDARNALKNIAKKSPKVFKL